MGASHDPDADTVRREFADAVNPTDDDLAHVRTVHGYEQRHLAQRPGQEEPATSAWRYSLMNWGHEPLTKG
jgi:hypothetical protein